jgi:serine protease Do
VGKGSPAENAGLASGDIIVSFDGHDIETSADLPHIVGLIAPGTSVEAVIMRDGEERSLEVEVGALAADAVARVETEAGADGTVRLLGMRIAPVEADLLSDLGITGGASVVGVKPGSPADESGVQEGDILTRLGSRPISQIADLDGVADELSPGASVPARLIRGRSPLFIGIRIPESD